MLSETLDAAKINITSIEEQYAFDILRNLHIDKLSQLKSLLKVEESQALGSETLQKFIKFAKGKHFELTESGVNNFKEKHGLGNAPPWKGIIGSQTAEVYFQEIIALFTDKEINQIVHPNGAWIWNLGKLRTDYLQQLIKSKVKRVYLKVFDGKSQPMFWKHQCSPEIVKRFKSAGIQVYGWGFHYGTSDVTAQISAVKQALDCGLDGYILDLESEVENQSTHANVERLLSELRPFVKTGTLGYTSFGHPGFHPNIPWKILDRYCDIALPQIYFEKFGFAPTNEAEVQACIDAHKKLNLIKPILPIWGSESDTKQPASAREIQSYLNRFPGSSIFLLPHVGESGVAWDLDYSNQKLTTSVTDQPQKFELPTLTRILRQGTKGEDVKALQIVLNAQGFNVGEVDGDFDEQTKNAVIKFQTKAGITIDGEVGPQTWKVLDPESKANPPSELGIRAKLAYFAEDEAAKGLRWEGSNSEAEKYLKPFRVPMQRIGHIGSTPVLYDWCAAFVTYCCREVGINIPDQPEGFWATMALVESWKYWGKQKGYWYQKGSITPQRGDILVFEWGNQNGILDHIGIVRGYTAGSSTILTSEGNRGNRSGNFTREMSFVAGFIRIS
jgi:Putative peptidoglycan binding domain/CHAP domain